MKDKSIVICGLGYVGLPLAYHFSKKMKVYAYDNNKEKVELYKKGIDITNELGNDLLKQSNIEFSSNPKIISKADYIIVSVPTPVDKNNLPDLTPILEVSKTIGKFLKDGVIVIYESTVYPGVTEEICKKEIQKYCNKRFKIGYSPERINPGDDIHTLVNTAKIVSGEDIETTKSIFKLYSLIISDVVLTPSIKSAEMSKLIENIQRDVNIAFINEMTQVCHKFDLSIYDVLSLAKTKWNFLDFKPGLVGGHCIGVDPYYLIHKSKELKYNPKIISNARELNEDFSKYIVNILIKNMILNNIDVNNSNIKIYGFTFKENVKDARNTKIVDLIKLFQEYNINIYVEDPYFTIDEINTIYDLKLRDDDKIKYDAIIYAVDHRLFKSISINTLCKKLKENGIIFDLKHILEKEEIEKNNVKYITM